MFLDGIKSWTAWLTEILLPFIEGVLIYTLLLPLRTFYVTMRAIGEGSADSFQHNPPEFKEKVMSKVLKKARPVVEATVVSLVLVLAALAIPAAILYAAV